MRIALVTDAWKPQVNGVVTTLAELVPQLMVRGHTVLVQHPGLHPTRPCPGYPGIALAVRPARALAAALDAFAPEAIHIATEGPLGWAARRYCLRRGLAFSTAFHTKFPEILQSATRLPLGLGYAVLRHFHRPSSSVMVPTRAVLQMLAQRGFRNLRAWTHGVDTAGFGFAPVVVPFDGLGAVERPVSLYVGRVSYEKNIEAFLSLGVPGTKVVSGVGPVLEALRRRHPEVRWLGVLPRDELARLYASADVFVFPSRADTFGLVMLEAMVTGTPVAAFVADGPTEVLGQPGATEGGAVHDNLAVAWSAALGVSRLDARTRALQFSWAETARLFESHLVPVRRPSDVRMTCVMKPSRE